MTIVRELPRSHAARSAVGLGGGGAARAWRSRRIAAAAGNPANLPPNVPDWSRYLGEGVAVRSYGKPSSTKRM